jgi:hypothetical protein
VPWGQRVLPGALPLTVSDAKDRVTQTKINWDN